MNVKKETRIKELMEYVRLLENMQRSGFQCKSEMKTAMAELHELMLPRKEKLNVVVLERSQNVQSISGYYKDILGMNATIKPFHILNENLDRVFSGHMEVRSENVHIYIVDEDMYVNENFLPNKERINYVVNNTSNFDLPVTLGLQAG